MVKGNKIAAFTIFEVTVVLAILGILISIIASSLNRFQEQIKLDTQLKGELNHWMLIRSNLWREFYDADSLKLENNHLFLFQENRIIQYSKIDEYLSRKEDNGEWKSLEVELTEIKIEKKDEIEFFSLIFPFKEEEMILKFPTLNKRKNNVNNYFRTLDD